MKKVIKYFIACFFIAFVCGIIIFLNIVPTKVESKTKKFYPIKKINEPIVDWINVDNPKKKEYLEYLYNTSK
jgi:hypothetical protein